jgi:hypothetical protein
MAALGMTGDQVPLRDVGVELTRGRDDVDTIKPYDTVSILSALINNNISKLDGSQVGFQGTYGF